MVVVVYCTGLTACAMLLWASWTRLLQYSGTTWIAESVIQRTVTKGADICRSISHSSMVVSKKMVGYNSRCPLGVAEDDRFIAVGGPSLHTGPAVVDDETHQLVNRHS